MFKRKSLLLLVSMVLLVSMSFSCSAARRSEKGDMGPGDTSGGSAVYSESAPGSPAPASTGMPEESPDLAIATDERKDDTDYETGEKPAPELEKQSKMQSGSLTAGSFDDNRYFDVFRKYVSNTLQNREAQGLPALNIGRRVVITVTDDKGSPLGNARATVSAQENIVTLVTGSDGRAVFSTGWDQAGNTENFSLKVKTVDGQIASGQFDLDSLTWDISVASASAQLPNKLDLAFVVDATGSMGDELEYLKLESKNIAEMVGRKFPNVDMKFALIVYRDKGDEYVTRKFDFSERDEFLSNISPQYADGGGDYPEAMDKALEDAVELSWRSGNTARVLFLIADAPPHSEDSKETLAQVNALRLSGVRIYPLAASGVADEAEYIMRSAAFLTMGEYLFLTNDSGIGNSHAEPHIPFYHVEKLNMLMVRMIASELAGKKIDPKPEHILRTSGKPPEQTLPQR